MDEIPLSILFLILVGLLALSAFFSGAETSMMAVNRYRLRHRAKAGHHGARLAERLLAQTDRLLAVILLGNNLVNAAAASLVTLITFRILGADELALTIATLSVTFLILVFSEVTPKVVASIHADRLAPWASYPLALLLRITRPIIWFINLFVHGLMALLRIHPATESQGGNTMGVEELRTLLAESAVFLPQDHRGMLMNLFDLEKLAVDDVMIPRNQVESIDIEAEYDELVHQIQTARHARIPVHAGEPGNVQGILSVRRALAALSAVRESADEENETLAALKAQILALLKPPYFIPVGTPLLTQLAEFRRTRRRMGLVVDEYGEIQGLLTLADLLEEIVGEFSNDVLEGPGWVRQEDGSVLVEGSASLRELNRKLGLDFPTDGPRTLNGLVLELLEAMPEPDSSMLIAGHPVDLIQVQERMVKTARIHPRQQARHG